MGLSSSIRTAQNSYMRRLVATKLGVLSGGSGGHGKKGGDVVSETAKNVLGGNRFSVCDGERYWGTA